MLRWLRFSLNFAFKSLMELVRFTVFRKNYSYTDTHIINYFRKSCKEKKEKKWLSLGICDIIILSLQSFQRKKLKRFEKKNIIIIHIFLLKNHEMCNNSCNKIITNCLTVLLAFDNQNVSSINVEKSLMLKYLQNYTLGLIASVTKNNSCRKFHLLASQTLVSA